MKKNFLLSITLTVVSFILVTVSAQADPPEPPPPTDFEAIYMTNSSSSRTAVSTFDWDDIPYLYLKLPENTDVKPNAPDVTFSFWNAPSGNSYQENKNNSLNENNEVWISLSDWVNRQETGLWTVDAQYKYPTSGMYGSGSTSFSVTPEPVSMALFLIGGAPMAAGLYRKKKEFCQNAYA